MTGKKTFTRKQEAILSKLSRYMDVKDSKTSGLFDWNSNEGIRDGICSLVNEQNFDKELVYEALKRAKIEFNEKEERDFNVERMVDLFLDRNPMFYDRAKILWRWNKYEFLWEQIDTIDLGIIVAESNRYTFNKIDLRHYFNLILQRARLRIPKNPEPTWIQFRDKIYDLSTGESFKATPEYFVTNPIPYSLGENEDTPNIDKLFREWVGEKYIHTLYEITAYNLTPNKFMQRLFALIGGGSNGKSTYIGLIRRIIGDKNYTSSELKLLAERNFETAILYKKLLCIIGEVSYDDLKNTSQVKKLSGEDEIRFEFKGKQPFSDKNTCSIICLTNSLPKTPDKSIGFYRRWLIVDFPTQFPVGKNPVDEITNEEISNMLLKCFNILRGLWVTRKFTNEGSYQERERLYEEKSNPVILFISEHCEDTPGKHTPKKEFYDKFNEWLRTKHQRPMSSHQITRMLKDNSYDISSRKINGESGQVVVNVSFKEITTITTITGDFQVDSSYIGTNLKNPSNLGNLGNCSLCNSSDAFIIHNDNLYCPECARKVQE